MDTSWQEIRDALLADMDMSHDTTDTELMRLISTEVGHYSRGHLITLGEREIIGRRIFNSLRRLDVLQELMDDPLVTEILVNGADHIFYEKKGSLHRWEGETLSAERLENLIQQIVGVSDRRVNEAQPIADARLPDGSRVNVVMPPVSLDGAALSIRKFTREPMTMERLIALGSLSDEVAEFLVLMVEGGYNIFVSGGTGSGKTTFLNALSQAIPKDQRVITIEDSAELQMKSIPNIVRLETREDNGSGARPVTIRDLIKTSLRMRPDRLIVGEVRDGAALDLLQAINTGHDGSLSTGHANSSEDMIHRLETMVLMAMDLPLPAIRSQIASGLDILVHLARMRDGSRKLLEVSEIDGMKDGEVCLRRLYEFKETGKRGERVSGVWEKKDELKNKTKLKAAGLV